MPPKKLTHVNGHGAKREYDLNQHLLDDIRVVWNEGLKKYGEDPMMYSRISVLAMTQLAAIVGLDVGMTVDQFLAVCRAQYEGAYRNAPRFS